MNNTQPVTGNDPRQVVIDWHVRFSYRVASGLVATVPATRWFWDNPGERPAYSHPAKVMSNSSRTGYAWVVRIVGRDADQLRTNLADWFGRCDRRDAVFGTLKASKQDNFISS